jgi:RNA polymerase sigma-70 factor (sigma-E family)
VVEAGVAVRPALREGTLRVDADLEAFCRREHARLVGAVAYLVGDGELAEDLVQEVLLRVVRRWEHVARLESPGGWAHRVAVNLALSALRSRRTRRRIDEQLARWAAPPAAGDPATAVTVRRAVAMLPERQRVAIVLRYYADLSVEEVADVMGCPPGTVKTLTSRAIAGLRAMGLETRP